MISDIGNFHDAAEDLRAIGAAATVRGVTEVENMVARTKLRQLGELLVIAADMADDVHAQLEPGTPTPSND
jgi:hypothetical protein